MVGTKKRLLGVAAVLALGWCLAAPSGAGAVPIITKSPEKKILGLPAIPCAPAKLSYIIDGGNYTMCGGKSTMVGPGWNNYAWPGAINNAYYYVSGYSENGSEKISFFPTITVPGLYEIWASYRFSENRTAAAPFYVYTDSNATYKVVVNQKEPGGAIASVKLGTYYFKKHALAQSPRTTGYVECDNEGLRSSEAVDAVFFKYVGPITPTGLAASDATATDTITLTWKSVPGSSKYRVLRSATNSISGATLIAEVAAPTVTYNDTPLSEGETYFYWVKAVGALGKVSAPSASDQGSTGVTTP